MFGASGTTPIDTTSQSSTIDKSSATSIKRKPRNMFKARKNRPEPQVPERTFSSSEVAQVASVSLRQLQWWDERKVVSPRHEGHRRVYGRGEVIEITVIAELRRKGFSLQKIRRVLRFLQREMGKRLAELMQAGSELHLVTDGKSIFLEDQHERIIDILKNARQPMFLVCVSDQARRLSDTERKPVRMEPGVATQVRRARVG
jgi:DNA-binding transcriptional MerR regulator